MSNGPTARTRASSAAQSVERRNSVTDPDRDDARVAMGYWTPEDLPFYASLARTFPLADHWYSSCLGPTFPNRRFLIAGTANGLTSDSPRSRSTNRSTARFSTLLARHQISWANYHRSRTAALLLERGLQGARAAGAKRRGHGRRRRARLVEVAMHSAVAESLLQFTADLLPPRAPPLRPSTSARSTASVRNASTGDLPAVSIVDPIFPVRRSEENPQDINMGRSVRGQSDQCRHARAGLGAHAAHLAL